MRALEIIKGNVIYNPAYTYKFQLKTTLVVQKRALEKAKYNFPLKLGSKFRFQPPKR